MHHTGPGSAATSHLSEGGVRPDAGLLAERALHEAEHQGDLQHAPESGQSLSGVPGHPGLMHRRSVYVLGGGCVLLSVDKCSCA